MQSLEQFDGLKADITLAIKPVMDIKVINDQTKENALNAAGQLQAFKKKVDDKRKDLIKPLNDQVKDINDYAKTILKPALDAIDHCKRQLSDYETELRRRREAEQARLDAERIEAERKAREEAERKARELEAKHQKEMAAIRRQQEMEAMWSTKPIKDDGRAEQIHEQQERECMIAKAEAERKLHQTNRLYKSEEKALCNNRVKNARQGYDIIITDAALVPRQYCIPDMSLLRKAVKEGALQIPGVNIKPKISIAIRSQQQPVRKEVSIS